MPPRRASTAARRGPVTEPMLLATIGMVHGVPSPGARSTSIRLATSDLPGLRNTSEYVRSWAGASPVNLIPRR